MKTGESPHKYIDRSKNKEHSCKKIMKMGRGVIVSGQRDRNRQTDKYIEER